MWDSGSLLLVIIIASSVVIMMKLTQNVLGSEGPLVPHFLVVVDVVSYIVRTEFIFQS